MSLQSSPPIKSKPPIPLMPIRDTSLIKTTDLCRQSRQEALEKSIRNIAETVTDWGKNLQYPDMRNWAKRYFTNLNQLLKIFEASGFQVSEGIQESKFSLHRAGSRDKFERKKGTPQIPLDKFKGHLQKISEVCHKKLPYAKASYNKAEPHSNLNLEQVKALKLHSSDLARLLNELLKGDDSPFSVIEDTKKKKDAFILYCTFEDPSLADIWKKYANDILSRLKKYIPLLNLDNEWRSKYESAFKTMFREKIFGENIETLLATKAEKLFQKIQVTAENRAGEMRRCEREELIAKFRILKFYSERLSEIAEALVNPSSYEAKTHEKILHDLNKLLARTSESQRKSLLKGLGEGLKIHYIETHLSDKLEKMVKEIFNRHQHDKTYELLPWSYEDTAKKYLEMMGSAKPAEILADWRRAIYGGLISFFDPQWKLLVGPMKQLEGGEKTPEKLAVELYHYIVSLEKLVSERVFQDPSGSLLTDLREILSPLIPLRHPERKEDILDTHERIFDTLAPIFNLIKEKGMEALPPEMIALLQGVEEILKAKHPEVLKKAPLLTIATYLLNFYRCLYGGMFGKTLSIHSELYILLFGQKEEYAVQSINPRGLEEEWKDEYCNQINIILGPDKISFQYLMRREIAKNSKLECDMKVVTINGRETIVPVERLPSEKVCFLNQQVTVEVPSIDSKESKMRTSEQLFTYEINSDNRDHQLQKAIKTVLRRWALIAEARGFPDNSILPLE